MAWYTLSAHVPKSPGILGHRDMSTLSWTFLDINFVIINGRGKCSTCTVIVKLAFLVPPFLSCLSRVSFFG